MATNSSKKTKDNKNTKKEKVVVKKTVVVRPISGFSQFIREYGVVGLAVGFVFGTQVKAVVDQLTVTFINPIIGLVLPGKGDLVQKTYTLHSFSKHATFGWGAFLNTFISFILVVAIIYFIIKALKLDKFDMPKV